MERKEEAIIMIELAGDPARLPSLAGPRVRNAFTLEGYSAHSEPSTLPSRKERRRDLSSAKGAPCAP